MLAGLSITGYIDPVYLYNRAQHTAGFQFLNRDPGIYDHYNSMLGDLYLDIRRAKESCHQKRSNVVNTCFCVAIAAATKKHFALPKGGQCTLVVCHAPWRATRNGRQDRGGSYQKCGCRNAARWRYDSPCGSLGASKGSADISSRRALPHRTQ
ncbi:DUF3138 family protein [Paraburkholderia domus]|uniref:DUF3138 family protein n=1 Tax=Paraburkholderia domus TaxID=2793075 RepID=UPI001EF02122|nr:DUF3138 family protein [Paraburkholderia domus]